MILHNAYRYHLENLERDPKKIEEIEIIGPYNKIANREPILGDYVITRVYVGCWIWNSYGKVIGFNKDKKNEIIELQDGGDKSKHELSYEKKEYVIIEQDRNLTKSYSKDEVMRNFPSYSNQIIDYPPKVGNNVIIKIDIGWVKERPRITGKVISLDENNKKAIVSLRNMDYAIFYDDLLVIPDDDCIAPPELHDVDYRLKNIEPKQKKGLLDIFFPPRHNSYNYTNADVEEYISREMSNKYEIMEDFMPMVGDEIITKSRRSSKYPELSHGKVLKVDPINKTAIIELSETTNIYKNGISNIIHFYKDLLSCYDTSLPIWHKEQKFSFNEFTIIKKRIRPTDEEILKNMPEPYNMIVNRSPVVGDKIITKVRFRNWLPLSFGEVISIGQDERIIYDYRGDRQHSFLEENGKFMIRLVLPDTLHNFSYKNDEFAVIERKPKLTDDISDEQVNIPRPYTKIVKRDPKEFDHVIAKTQLGRNLPNNIGEVVHVDLTKKEAVISMGPNDTFILSYEEWKDFAILG